MTDGTSQGLFVVVSIVIFGIFVALSYTVFGDTLSPSMQGMFNDATEQALSNTVRRRSMVDINRLGSFLTYHTYPVVENNSFHIEKSGDGMTTAVRVIDYDARPPKDKTYKISGYLLKNGEPVSYDGWERKTAASRQTLIDFSVDDNTGYFESINLWDSDTLQQYVFYTRLTDIKEGDIITVVDFMFEEIK